MMQVPILVVISVGVTWVVLMVTTAIYGFKYDKYKEKAAQEKSWHESLKGEYNRKDKMLSHISRLAPNFFELFSYEKPTYESLVVYGCDMQRSTGRTHRIWDEKKLARASSQLPTSQSKDDQATLELLNEGGF